MKDSKNLIITKHDHRKIRIVWILGIPELHLSLRRQV